MKRLIRTYKKFRNFFLLLKYWDIINTAQKLEKDPDSEFSRGIFSKITKDELLGFDTLKNIGYLLMMNKRQLKKELKQLQRHYKY